MKMKMLLLVLLISSGVSACSSHKKVTVNGASKKTAKDIMKSIGGNQPESYRQGVQHWQTSPANAPAPNYSDYTRSEAKELNGLFPRLPNPDLCMYVFPHLSGENATVPGYTSCFAMYDTNQYALPGEMMANWQYK